jgi:hypothetical protein
MKHTKQQDVVGDLEAGLVHVWAGRHAGHNLLLDRVDLLAGGLEKSALPMRTRLSVAVYAALASGCGPAVINAPSA